VEDYINNKVRQDIINEIRNLELPEDWKPQMVIDYILRKIDRE